jgi:hypothetical protein
MHIAYYVYEYMSMNLCNAMQRTVAACECLLNSLLWCCLYLAVPSDGAPRISANAAHFILHVVVDINSFYNDTKYMSNYVS